MCFRVRQVGERVVDVKICIQIQQCGGSPRACFPTKLLDDLRLLVLTPPWGVPGLMVTKPFVTHQVGLSCYVC